MEKLSAEIWLDTEPRSRLVVDDVGDVDFLLGILKPTVSVKLTAVSPGARMTGSISVYTEPTRTVIVAGTVQEAAAAYRRLLAGEPPEQVYVPTPKSPPPAPDRHRHPCYPSASRYYGRLDGDGVDFILPS